MYTTGAMHACMHTAAAAVCSKHIISAVKQVFINRLSSGAVCTGPLDSVHAAKQRIDSLTVSLVIYGLFTY